MNAADLFGACHFSLDQRDVFTGLIWKDYLEALLPLNYFPYVFMGMVRDDQGRLFVFEAFYLQAWLRGEIDLDLDISRSSVRKVYLLGARSFKFEGLEIEEDDSEIDENDDEQEATNQSEEVGLETTVWVDTFKLDEFGLMAEIDAQEALPHFLNQDVPWLELNNPWRLGVWPFQNIRNIRPASNQILELFQRRMEQRERSLGLPLAERQFVFGQALVEEDQVEALYWLHTASEQGHDAARDLFKAEIEALNGSDAEGSDSDGN